MNKYQNKSCVCIATGDKNGPMESWNIACDAKLVIIPTKELGKTHVFFPL